VVRIDDRNYVLTNRHVIDGATPQKINITLADGRPLQPTKVWADVETDVAVMAVDAPGLVAAELGEDTPPEIGDFVLAMGSPFGLSRSVTFGIISAKGRRDLQLGNSGLVLQDFLQTDAAINPGNSGGPLINLRGQVIGINTAIASNSGGSEGIGFAIPIRMFMFTARQLVAHGNVRRAYLGVTLDRDFDAQRASALGLPGPFGALVMEVRGNSPAANSGLKSGDVILQFNGVTVEDDAHLVNIVKLTEVGSRVSLVVLRDRSPQAITLHLAEWTGQ
jgi:serine protease Do